MNASTPVLVAAGAALLALLTDLIVPRWRTVLGVALLGAVSTLVVAVITPTGHFGLLCAGDGVDCSYVYDSWARLFSAIIAGLTVAALLLYLPTLSTADAPPGETTFLLLCAMAGGVALAGSGDLITLIVSLETLTLPLYGLVALHRKRAEQGASAAVTFFTTSVVATAVTLMGAALIYLASGAVHLRGDTSTPFVAGGEWAALGVVGLGLVLTGLGFKVAAVPLHAWAPSTYDGAPLPLAAYLSTASKLGGVIAILLVLQGALDTNPSGQIYLVAGATLALLAGLSLIVGTLVALRQSRVVRLLAWSSVAQAGFILAPLGGLVLLRASGPAQDLVSASVAYTLFFLALELSAFSGLAALRPPAADGGTLADLRGLGRSAPLRGAAFALALIGLAGLPPTLAGLFAKFTVLQALLNIGAFGLSALVAVVSVVGLAVYWRPIASLYSGSAAAPAPASSLRSTAIPLALAAAAVAALSLLPQLALSAPHLP